MQNAVATLVILLLLLSTTLTCSTANPSFTITGNDFTKDGHAFQILSGSMHYFRIPPELWVDRLAKAVGMGLNTIQTYVPWNVHMPTTSAVPNWSAGANLTRFVGEAQAAGLLVILRVGPYICGEWEFGGFPSYLLKSSTTLAGVRCAGSAYEEAYGKWFEVLGPVLKPLLYENGGPVIMLQIENEYGSYGDDKSYLLNVRQALAAQLGESVIYYSTDGCEAQLLASTQANGIFQTCDFGPPDAWPSAADSFAVLRQYQATGPLMNSEYYTGWLTHWGDARMAYRSTDAVVQGIEAMLAMNASFNLYMFHGGSNFGFANGANTPDDDPSDLQVSVQSYDYDAPLSEAGDITEKYLAIRGAILKHTGKQPALPTNSSKAAYGTVDASDYSSLWDVLLLITDGFPVFNQVPMTYEQLSSAGNAYGFVLYTSSAPAFNGTLRFQAVHDYALVYTSGLTDTTLQGVVVRNGSVPAVAYTAGAHKDTLVVLVENHGRVNYGPYLLDYKGLIDGGARLNNQFLFAWQHFKIPLNNISGVPFFNRSTKVHHDGPVFYRGKFEIVGTPLDTFLTLPNWQKGHIWINNHHIGRYWNQLGPQYSFYIPAPFLQQGTNTVIIFELLAAPEQRTVEFKDVSLNSV